MDQFLYGFMSTNQLNKVDSVCIVPLEYWNLKKRKMHNYIKNNSIADQIEQLGLIECKQNTFEFNSKKYSKEDIIRILSTIEELKYSEEFNEYLNNEGD